MSGGLLDFLFPSADARTIGSVDLSQPGGVVQVPVGPNYQAPPGFQGVTPDQTLPFLGPNQEGPGVLPFSDPITSDGGTVVIQPLPGNIGTPLPGIPGPDGSINPDTTPPSAVTPGWFYDWNQGKFVYQNADGTVSDTAPNAQGQQVPGLGGILNPPAQAVGGAVGAIANVIPSINWIEELAIRAMLVIVGLVLIFGGFYVAGSRSSRTTIVEASPARTSRNIARVLAS